MGICIAGKSALKWWLGEGRPYVREQFVALMPASMLTPSEAERSSALNRFATDGVLETLVSRQADRARRAGCVEHCYSQLGKRKLFYQVDEFTQICAPELALLQVLRHMDDIQWIVLASRVFSSYAKEDSTDPHPLTTAGRCADVSRDIPRSCNSERALRLLGKCVSEAESPREIQVALLLTLPRRMGGYGLPKPELNGKISLSAAQLKDVGTPYLRGDAVWRSKKVIAEYDSDLHHANAYQLGVDSRRRAIFRNKGFRVHTITNNQVIYEHETDRLAEAISRDLNYRANSRPQDYEQRKAQLRRAILESPYL